jgi:hypothetical protein
MNRVAAKLPARHSSSSVEITMEPDGLQTFIAVTSAQSPSGHDEEGTIQR